MTTGTVPPSSENWTITITQDDLTTMIEERRQVLAEIKEIAGRLRFLNKKVAAAEYIASWAKLDPKTDEPGSSE